MLSKEDFVAEHRHELAGVVADGATCQRAGAPLAMFLRDAMRRIDARLAAIYNQLHGRADPVSLDETVKRDLEQRLREAPKEVRALAAQTNGHAKGAAR